MTACDASTRPDPANPVGTLKFALVNTDARDARGQAGAMRDHQTAARRAQEFASRARQAFDAD